MRWFDLHTHRAKMEMDSISIFSSTDGDDLSCHNYLSVGLHPWFLTTQSDSLLQMEIVRKRSLGHNVVAIGECGLDKICTTDFELQRQIFELQVEWSEEIEKPMIIHCVKAFEELIAIRKWMKPKQRWVVHGFRGNAQQAQQLISNGFLLSFGEMYNEKTIKSVPLSSVFIETDESSLGIEQIYDTIARARGISKNLLLKQMIANGKSLFPTIEWND